MHAHTQWVEGKQYFTMGGGGAICYPKKSTERAQKHFAV